jgi:hypothetical protein
MLHTSIDFMCLCAAASLYSLPTVKFQKLCVPTNCSKIDLNLASVSSSMRYFWRKLKRVVSGVIGLPDTSFQNECFTGSYGASEAVRRAFAASDSGAGGMSKYVGRQYVYLRLSQFLLTHVFKYW